MSDVAVSYAILCKEHPQEVQQLIKLARKGNAKNRNSEPDTWSWGYTWYRLASSHHDDAILLTVDERIKQLVPLAGMSIYATLPSGHVQRLLQLSQKFVNDPPPVVKQWYRSLYEVERNEALKDSKNNQSYYKEKE